MPTKNDTEGVRLMVSRDEAETIVYALFEIDEDRLAKSIKAIVEKPVIKSKKHWHQWLPNDKRVETVKSCKCGAFKRWDGSKWRVAKKGHPRRSERE